MNIGEVLNGVFDAELGWRPASGAVKPVHIANGLVRALLGNVYDVQPIVDVVVWKKQGEILDDRRLEALLDRDWGQALEAFRDDSPAFDRTRRYLRGVLAADGAVFPTGENSSLTLTCATMVSRDHNDRGLGEFGFSLLGGSADAPLVRVLREKLSEEHPSDPLTLSVWPLLPTDGRPASRTERSASALKRRHNQAVLAQFRLAADSLASHEGVQANRLRALERAVHFVCVATHAHAQALAANGKLDSRPPVLLVTDAAKGSELATASERSLQNVYDLFAEWLGRKLGERIGEGKEAFEDGTRLSLNSVDVREARKVLRSIGVAKKPHGEPTDEILAERVTSFVEMRKRTSGDPALSLGTALADCYVREYQSGGPREALTRLCTRTGFLFPYYQGRSAEKRVQPSSAVLDMMVRACVAADESVPLSEFLVRLWLRFGLITGGRREREWDDSEYLHAHGVGVDPQLLVQNTEALVSQLVTMGLARRFPDNVTYVGVLNVA